MEKKDAKGLWCGTLKITDVDEEEGTMYGIPGKKKSIDNK